MEFGKSGIRNRELKTFPFYYTLCLANRIDPIPMLAEYLLFQPHHLSRTNIPSPTGYLIISSWIRGGGGSNCKISSLFRIISVPSSLHSISSNSKRVWHLFHSFSLNSSLFHFIQHCQTSGLVKTRSGSIYFTFGDL